MALAFGRWDVDDFAEEIGSAQLGEWLALEKVDGPLGGRRQDTYHAREMFYLAALAGVREGSPEDYVVQWLPEPDWRDAIDEGYFERTLAQYAAANPSIANPVPERPT